MDFQLPTTTMTPAAPTNGPVVGAGSRGGQGRQSCGSPDSGRSFASELHAAKNSHETRGAVRASRSDKEMNTTSDATTSSSTTTTNTDEQSQTCEHHAASATEQQAEADSKPETNTTPDAATQSTLLAIGITPVVPAAAEPVSTESATVEPPQTSVSVLVDPLVGGESRAEAIESLTEGPVHSDTAGQTKLVTPSTAMKEEPSNLTSTIAPATSPGDAAKLSPTTTPDTKTLTSEDFQDHVQAPRVERKSDEPVVAVTQDKNQTKVDPEMIHSDERRPAENAVAQQSREVAPHHAESDERPVMAVKPDNTQDIPPKKDALAPRQAETTPVAWRGMSEDDTQSNPNWSGREQGDRQSSEQHALPFPAMAHEPSPATQPHPGFMIGGTDPKSMPVVSAAPTNQQPHQATPAPAVPPTDWMPAASPTGTRSMVLEVSQADLGRVNIRVAVNQDVVHTHFSSERGDMGQYLANGQEKLQAALQTSGLDLGQFRVDIDRQSAGRSFQQQASHDQRPGTHSQGQGQGQTQDQHQQAFRRDSTPHRGMLNLVA